MILVQNLGSLKQKQHERQNKSLLMGRISSNIDHLKYYRILFEDNKKI